MNMALPCFELAPFLVCFHRETKKSNHKTARGGGGSPKSKQIHLQRNPATAGFDHVKQALTPILSSWDPFRSGCPSLPTSLPCEPEASIGEAPLENLGFHNLGRKNPPKQRQPQKASHACGFFSREVPFDHRRAPASGTGPWIPRCPSPTS